jgi:cell fate (sporulation/competence/biofilm development) regulator YmcA (YheA/YmcA/DUF963 family)
VAEIAEFGEDTYNGFITETQNELKVADKSIEEVNKVTRTQEELEALPKEPVNTLNTSTKSIAETEAFLQVEAKGENPVPITRDMNPKGADFIEASGVKLVGC